MLLKISIEAKAARIGNLYFAYSYPNFDQVLRGPSMLVSRLPLPQWYELYSSLSLVFQASSVSVHSGNLCNGVVCVEAMSSELDSTSYVFDGTFVPCQYLFLVPALLNTLGKQAGPLAEFYVFNGDLFSRSLVPEKAKPSIRSKDNHLKSTYSSLPRHPTKVPQTSRCRSNQR